MGLSCGIVGVPNAGKSTIFNALTCANAQTASYPFTTIEPNTGIVEVPDERLTKLARIIKPERIIPATLKFIDIAGLVKGASKGEGLGNRFLAHIREVDAIVHVVRCFERKDVSHVFGDVDPKRDIETVNLELLLADLETVEKRLSKAEKAAKSGSKEARLELEFFGRLKEHLARGNPVRTLLTKGEEEERILGELNLLTKKPVLYVANLEDVHEPLRPFDKTQGSGQAQSNEGQLNEINLVEIVEGVSREESGEFIKIYGKLEAELAELPEDERGAFLEDLGFKESGLDRLIKAAYRLLGLITFYTTNGIELRAWTVGKDTKAPKAAGKIHTDFERGFIRAEVISFEDYVGAGSEASAREKGVLRIEGKDYKIRDGDVVYFKFNV